MQTNFTCTVRLAFYWVNQNQSYNNYFGQSQLIEASNPMNQSELEAQVCVASAKQEKMFQQVTIDFGFISDWLRIVTWGCLANQLITFNTQVNYPLYVR